MRVPEELQLKLNQEIQQLEGEKKNRFLMSIERDAIHQERVEKAREVLLETLEIRFQGAPAEVVGPLEQIEDEAVLGSLYRRALVAQTLEEFQQALS